MSGQEVPRAGLLTAALAGTITNDEEAGDCVHAAVRRILRARGVRAEHFEALLASVMAQAEALYAAWPVAA